jgi:Putative MetA-pathway of phenol degradation
MRISRLTAVSSIVAASWFVADSAGACSVCGCDPAAGTLGVDRPSAQSFRLAVEDRYLQKESGVGDDAESEREDRLLVRAQYAPLDRLVLQLEVPVFLFKNHLDATGFQDDSAHGLGDVALGARYELLRLGLEARHVVVLTGAIKLPTGQNDRIIGGATEPDEHTQLGTGSYDGLAGVTYLYGARPWTLYSNLTGRLNGSNSRDFRYGHALFATLGARRSFLDTGRLVLGLEGQLRAAAKDHRGDGTYDDDSGGRVLYATGNAAYALTNDLLMRFVLQVPVVRDLNGVQSEHPVAYLAFSYDWSI